MAPPPPTDLERKLLRAFGRRLVHLRTERGLSQKAIAQKLGIRHELVSKYERGHHYPKLATLLRLRTLLSVTLDYLLAGASPGEITDPRLLKAARAANDLPPEDREIAVFALEEHVQAAQRILERGQAAATKD